ncbi:decaprenyl-phosphate phosphoribosyltransferase [Kamptonema cortianum]|nr:decaprenyl-phosphate phosphoribosyltransferase [Geitlerinema splendidum]MDK3162517.1 decaprenyl-phosphate phosphoribosyltransferase [Kamptonema cortianum]
MTPYIRLLRPKQWTKNLLVFAALLFSGTVTEIARDIRVVLAFVAMCLVSSATYIFNDIADQKRDQEHPVKKNRPIASGAISVQKGIALAIACLSIGMGIGWYLGAWATAILAGYVFLQVLYNIWLKYIAVADVFAIATGFILRAVLGAESIKVPISGWLLLCTAALALMLGFAKRRSEYISQGNERVKSRESLSQYSRLALDIYVAMFSGVAAMCYGIYTLQSETASRFPGLIITFPFVLYGICRYLLLVFAKDEGAQPEDILLKDPNIIISVVGFVIAALLAIRGATVPMIN